VAAKPARSGRIRMSTTPPVPRLSRARSFTLVWIVPVIAIALGGWMVARDLKNRGPEITIEFADGSGVAADKTTLEHKGVSVGRVTDVQLKSDLTGVIVWVRLEKSAAELNRAGALFWIVHPEIGLSGIRGLDTLLTGARLNVRPGTGEPVEHFVGLEKAPPPALPAEGKMFLLHSDRLGSLTTGAGVFYREMKVGVVETSRMSDDATGVVIRIHVDAPYTELIRTNTRFWNAGGFSFKIGLLGAELKNTSLESLISGGVAFATPPPENGTLAPAATEGAIFQVSAEPEKEWLKWSPKIPVRAPEVVTEPKESRAREAVN
jgi:paraquat-inducible protein B